MKLKRLTRMLALALPLLAAGWGAQAAIVLDLTTAGASGTINGATYTQVDPQPTGSGFIDSFVRISAANQDIVEGYNTTVNNTFDNTSDNTFNHQITYGSNSGMSFLLDINQTGSDPLLNLDEVQIFISTTANQSVETFTGGVLDLINAALVYRMDAGDLGNMVTLDYSLNSGSGSGDMTLDVLASAFDAAFAALGLTTDAQKSGAFVYLYSKFGSPPNNNNDGYEEWTVKTAPGNNVPEPGALALAVVGLLGAWWATRRRSV